MPSPALRTRIISAACVLLTIALGLAVRKFIGGAIGEHLGNAAWGVMWVLILYTLAPRARTAAVAALFIVVAIECFQLTPYPAAWSSRSTIARYALGGAFELRDIIGSTIGIAVAWLAITRAR